MPSTNELDRIYMQCAINFASLSKAKRKKVGSCLVTSFGVMIPSWNGTPQGTDNACEDSNGNTLDIVQHSELGSILKAAKEGVSILGSSLYVTLSPCQRCAAMIKQSGIKEVIYLEEYRCNKGLIYLEQNAIVVRKVTL